MKRLGLLYRQYWQQKQRFFSKSKQPQRSAWYIPPALGIAWLSALHLKHVRERTETPESHPDHRLEGPIHIHVYSVIPWRSLSKLWGALNSFTVPEWLRKPLFGLYASAFGCNLSEALEQNLEKYPNLGEFFYRKLKPDARQIDQAVLTSPSDGKVLCFGVVDENHRIENIKGASYSLPALIGTGATIASEAEFVDFNHVDYSLDKLVGTNGLKHTYAHRSDQLLYFCVIYLAPGDYHRFHSPADWTVESRRHFAGELYSVSPWMVGKIRNLFVLNERVALLGKWTHGFFSMIPVGATNVGSIKINFDPELATNNVEKLQLLKPGSFDHLKYNSVQLAKGQEIGGFQLGSTVVLVFEAPETFKFSINNGQTVKMGQELGQ